MVVREHRCSANTISHAAGTMAINARVDLAGDIGGSLTGAGGTLDLSGDSGATTFRCQASTVPARSNEAPRGPRSLARARARHREDIATRIDNLGSDDRNARARSDHSDTSRFDRTANPF